METDRRSLRAQFSNGRRCFRSLLQFLQLLLERFDLETLLFELLFDLAKTNL